MGERLPPPWVALDFAGAFLYDFFEEVQPMGCSMVFTDNGVADTIEKVQWEHVEGKDKGNEGVKVRRGVAFSAQEGGQVGRKGKWKGDRNGDEKKNFERR
jgi:hypothetical protein